MGGNPLHKLITTLRTQFFDAKLIKFVIVDVVNTLVGMAIMFGLYNLAGCSYWVSSAANYILTSILSYFLNKTFTFGNKDGVGSTALRFALNIAACYLLAYGIAKPAVNIEQLSRSGLPARQLLNVDRHGSVHRLQLYRSALFCFPRIRITRRFPYENV